MLLRWKGDGEGNRYDILIEGPGPCRNPRYGVRALEETPPASGEMEQDEILPEAPRAGEFPLRRAS